MEADKTGELQIKHIIKQVMTEFEAVKDQDIVLERMTGITNQTYKFYQKGTAKAYIYRKFGSATKNIFLDRESQQWVYEYISEHGLGPKIITFLEGVRIEQFINSSVLQTAQMLEPDYYKKVAFSLRRFHELTPSKIGKQSLIKEIFLPKEPKIMQICTEKLNQNIYSEEEKTIVQQLAKWVSHEELEFLGKAIEPLQKEQLVFTHNDLLANNILIESSTKKVVFIDYEYSRYNYRIFDIANYFNETEYDYDEPNPPYFAVIPPSPEKEKNKLNFIKCYCLAKQPDFQQYLKRTQEAELTENEIQQINNLQRQLVLGTMLSNMMWGWWAIIVSKNPAINFDYLKFAEKRLNDYTEAKNSGKWKL